MSRSGSGGILNSGSGRSLIITNKLYKTLFILNPSSFKYNWFYWMPSAKIKWHIE